MITVDKRPDPNGLWVQINGIIEENVDLAAQIGSFGGTLRVNCKNIIRINSVGVGIWIRYFQNLKASCKFFEFEDCSPAIVDQLNMISNFTCGGDVISVLLPYSCTVCNKEFTASTTVDAIIAAGYQEPPLKCGRDQCSAKFDDDPSVYFSFLKD